MTIIKLWNPYHQHYETLVRYMDGSEEVVKCLAGVYW